MARKAVKTQQFMMRRRSMAVEFRSAYVGDCMTTSVPVITPKTSIGTALKLLREHRVPALAVSEGTGLLGLVDERALLRLTPSEATTLDVYELRNVLDRLTVARVVTPAPATVAPGTEIDAAAALMLQEGVGVIPVVDGGGVVGLLTWTSVLAIAIKRGDRDVA
jgi:acetoin utilization protein AcuB